MKDKITITLNKEEFDEIVTAVKIKFELHKMSNSSEKITEELTEEQNLLKIKELLTLSKVIDILVAGKLEFENTNETIEK